MNHEDKKKTNDKKYNDIEVIYFKKNEIIENKLNSQIIPQNKRRINIFNTEEEIQNASKSQFIDIPETKEDDKNEQKKINNYIENNISVKRIVDDALFSQLSEINVKLLDFDENFFDEKKGKSLPKIDYVDIKLLNQNIDISEFKKYGFGLYVFFLYLKSILVTFLVLAIFAFHYMYRIFYNYYRDYEDEFSFYSDYNLLTLISGSQILRFRKYIIETYGKETFLEKYKDFDVFYKEYLITGTVIIIISFVINFIFLLYIQREYKQYRIENPEIKNYSLILSGKDVPYSKTPINDNDQIKNEILQELKIKNADINFSLKLSDYYKNLEKHIELTIEQNKIQNKINKENCCCNCCCCFCSKCFDCCCNKRYKNKNKIINGKIKILENEMDKIKKDNIFNKLYIITFENKNDYNKVYSSYSHSYITNLCRKKNIYINKAPSPEDIAWENLEFDNEYKYFIKKFINILIFLGILGLSFVCQLIGELIDHYLNYEYLFLINIIISYWLGKIEDIFTELIINQLSSKSNLWSYSDIKFYSIIFQTLFKFISKGIFPFLTSYCIEKWYNEEDNNYSDLASKMFILIEMDGFGYPMIDWLKNIVEKGREMYEITEKILSIENIEKEITEQVTNAEGLSKLELKDSFEKEEMDLEELYSDTVGIYWITMFYLSIYPVGLIQSFFNLLFKFIIEKNFLLNAYKRPEYINPQFGFLCFDFFSIGFFLFLFGNILFFKNEENKQSFGTIYITLMILILVIPFYLLGKLIMYITNYCCMKQNEAKKLNDINEKIKSDYRLFNPCSQKQKIAELFKKFKEDSDNNENKLLNEDQYNEIIQKLTDMKDIEFYRLQKRMRTPKFMTFEEKKVKKESLYISSYIPVLEDKKNKLYYLLMQLGFITYLEEGNLKPKRKPIEFYVDKNTIRSISLRNLSMQENLSNSDSGYFITYQDKENLIMPYIDNKSKVKLLDIFHRRVLDDVKGLDHMNEIVCLDYFIVGKNRYLVTIGLDNIMIITNLTENENSINIEKIANEIDISNKNNNYFSLSTIRHNDVIWIITSYFSDKCFKVFNHFGQPEFQVPIGEPIISLEGLFFTLKNTYICVRTPTSVYLFINRFFIKTIKTLNYEAYINFKIEQIFNPIIDNKYIIITTMDKNLISYNVEIITIYSVFPLYTDAFESLAKRMTRISFFQSINSQANAEINQAYAQQLSEDQNNNPLTLYEIPNIELKAEEEQRKLILNILRTENNHDRYNIGSILLWGNGYLIIGTPFNYLDIIDYINGLKVGSIQNDIFNMKEINNNIIYNISTKIYDEEYGECFIMRDSNGKLQYIRASRIKDKLNYRILKSDEFFNDLDDDIKLERVHFSANFYFYYIFYSYLFPWIAGLVGHTSDETKANNDIYYASVAFYALYAIIGIWFKGCVYDINDDTHTPRKLTLSIMNLFLVIKLFINSALAYNFCIENKTGIIFISMLILIFFVQYLFNYIVYCCKIKYLLRTYWLGFLFYQISRFCILLFFMICIISKANYIETFIYAGILCIISMYMYMVNYFNTLMKNMVYDGSYEEKKCKCCNINKSLSQAIFNYPFEWMNLFCCWYKNPKECIQEIDYKCCVCEPWCGKLFQCLLYLASCIFYIFIFLFAAILGVAKDSTNNNSN